MRKFVIFIGLALLCLACAPRNPERETAYVALATWDQAIKPLEFNPGNSTMDLDVVDNPAPDAVNPSTRCMRYVGGGGHSEFIWSKPWGRNFDFTANPPVFKMKVLAPKAGLRVYMTLEPIDLGGPVRPVTVRNVVSSTCGRWEDMVFDFTWYSRKNNQRGRRLPSF